MQFFLPKSSTKALAVSLLVALTGLQRPVVAEANQDPLLEIIDLSPGEDISSPEFMALNRTTHRLYVGAIGGVKVIDTVTHTVLAGIDSIHDTNTGFRITAAGADESAAPAGNKAYVAGWRSSSNAALLHVIDGETNTKITAGGADLLLPDGYYTSVVVNPVNHKVYLSTTNEEVVVVDGPGQQVLKTLTPNSGGVLVVNPVANKVFVLGRNGGAIIDSSTDTFTPLALGLVYATSAVFNPGDGRIYLAARLQDRSGIFVLDGVTGALLDEKTDIAQRPDALSIAPETNTLYAAEGMGTNAERIALYDTANLAFKMSFPARAAILVYDSPGGGRVFFSEGRDDANALYNSVGILDPATGAVSAVPVGYVPCRIAINTKTNRFYVADKEAPELLVMDGETHEVVARVPVNPTAKSQDFRPPAGDIALSEKLNRFYFPRRRPGSNSTVDVYDGATNLPRSSILVNTDIGGSLGEVEVDDNRGLIYVSATRAEANRLRHLIFVFGAETETLKKTITLGLGGFLSTTSPPIVQMAVNPATGRLYFVPGRTLQIIDGDSHAEIGSVLLEGTPRAIAINSQSNKIFEAIDTSDAGPRFRITVIDGATGMVETTFAPPQFGTEWINALAVDPERNILYAGYGKTGPGRIAAFDAGDNYRFIGPLDSDRAASLEFNGAANELLAANLTDSTVAVLRPERWKLFGNISTRGPVGPNADDVLIGGFIVTGPPGSSKKVVVRAIGPSLAEYGVGNALPDTTIELHDSLGNVITNDDWKLNESTNTSQEAEIVATGIPPRNDAESAMIAMLPPGPCTAVVRGKNGQAGVALIEVYTIDQAPNARLANIATRGSVGTADDAMIGGLIVQGLQPSRVVVRAIGPTMAALGVAGTLQDPTLELRDSNGGLIEFNDDWKRDEATGTSQEGEIVATSLPPTDDRESAILVALAPGQYTAVVRGKANTVGVALVEAYNIE